MKIVLNEMYLKEDIKVLGLSTRIYNALTRRGSALTIGDLIKNIEEDRLIRIKGLSAMSIQEIKIALQYFAALHDKDSMADENNILNQPIKCVFEIGDIDLKYLHENNIWTVEHLLSKTKEEIANLIKSPNCEKLIKSVESHELSFRPQNVSLEDWLKQLNPTKYVIKLINRLSDLNINEIPEKYRKTYAIGAGVVAKQELEQDVKPNTSNRILTKLIGMLNKSVKPTLNMSKQSICEPSDKTILSLISEDLSVIDSLENSFIVRYREELLKIIAKNSTFDINRKQELSNRIKYTNNYLL